MAQLNACPFCRALFRPDEGSVCPDCDVALAPMHTLGLSAEAEQDDLLSRPPQLPEHERLPFAFWGRKRGALVALAVLGLVLFFAPWVELIRPESVVRSGYDLARGRAGWLWGGAVGYLVLLPLALSRRSIFDMRGVRIAAAALASMTLIETLMMVLLPPQGHRLVPLELEWRWGLFASGVVSLLATFCGATFGGALPPLPVTPVELKPEVPMRRGKRTLH
ncbi:MAG TPA: hypothetical protein VFQ61_13800 [Polyangiaceae bacterium]|nr:hypothetical protein [Polyangiaceae bacterium]